MPIPSVFLVIGYEVIKNHFFSIETNISELQTRHCIILNGQILVKCAGGWLVKEGFIKSCFGIGYSRACDVQHICLLIVTKA